MYSVVRHGSGVEISADVKNTHNKLVPYAAAAALSKTAVMAKDRVVARMPDVFDRPTPYTMNSLRTEPASVLNLKARVAIKDAGGSRSLAQENYLYPEVEGGPRKLKRYERALQYKGVLASNQYTTFGRAAPLDQYGNIPASEIRSILASVSNKGTTFSRTKAGKIKAKPSKYFYAEIGDKKTQGIWTRENGTPRPVLIFISSPSYVPLLDFAEVIRETANLEFKGLFDNALSSLIARRG